jgi:hypothetical protein
MFSPVLIFPTIGIRLRYLLTPNEKGTTKVVPPFAEARRPKPVTR